MAVRFLAFVSRIANAEADLIERAQGRLTGFAVAYRSPTLTALCTSPQHSHSAGQRTGVILGTVFEGGRVSRGHAIIDETRMLRAWQSGGRTLLREIWGGYVAVLDRDENRSLHIMRDPSGALPCFYLRLGAVTIISSDVETLHDAGLLSTTIDWDHIARHLYAPDLPTSQTALAGCRELLPGERLSLTFSGPSVETVWSPWDFTSDDDRSNGPDLIKDLHETIELCVQSWASDFENILLGVSGGLDSSVIAACLSRQPTKWSALTMATRAAEGDERDWARQLTDWLNIPLIERFHRVEDVEVTAPSSAHLSRPLGLTFGQSQDKTKMALAEEQGFDAFFTGQGGDNVFCYMQSATPLVDHVLTHGLSPSLWNTMNDICSLTESSVWDVARSAIRRLADRNPAYRWSASRGLLAADIPSAYDSALTHPWLDAPKGALPGKAVHIAKLLRVQSTIEGFSRKTFGPLVTPLLAQPLIEFCLGIPTWTWCAEGQNRSPVRQAFVNLLPASLINRRSKAGPTSFAFEVLETYRQPLLEFLMDGRLAEKGLIDRTAIEHILDGRHVIRPPLHFDLMTLAETEAWLRHWTKALHRPEVRKEQVAGCEESSPVLSDRATSISAG